LGGLGKHPVWKNRLIINEKKFQKIFFFGGGETFVLEMYNETLICLTIANKALGRLGMILLNRPMNDFFDRELRREQQYDINE